MAVAVVCTGVVFHEYVYGVTPPLGVAVAVPLLPPLQLTPKPLKSDVVVVATSTGGAVIVTLPRVTSQPLASLTIGV